MHAYPRLTPGAEQDRRALAAVERADELGLVVPSTGLRNTATRSELDVSGAGEDAVLLIAVGARVGHTAWIEGRIEIRCMIANESAVKESRCILNRIQDVEWRNAA
jgi:hypothetical protein